MKLIAAADSKWGIGKEGDLLLSIPEDMKFFRETTRGKVLVMGRKTLQSFPGSKPLPGRLNIVLSNSNDAKFGGCVVCAGTAQLFELLKSFSSDDVFVIGGAMIYNLLTPYCDTAYITKMRFDGGAEVFINDFDSAKDWELVNESALMEHNGLQYSFTEYKNNNVIPLSFDSVDPCMSDYFKSKKTVGINVIIFDNNAVKAGYLRELNLILSAYFAPVEKGFNDVKTFLSEREGFGGSFEKYLLNKQLIASEKSFEALNRKYDPGCEYPTMQIQLTKESAKDFTY